jgi:hypothetical protein
MATTGVAILGGFVAELLGPCKQAVVPRLRPFIRKRINGLRSG